MCVRVCACMRGSRGGAGAGGGFVSLCFFFFWKTCEIERNQDRKQSLSYQLPSDALGVL